MHQLQRGEYGHFLPFRGICKVLTNARVLYDTLVSSENKLCYFTALPQFIARKINHSGVHLFKVNCGACPAHFCPSSNCKKR